MGELLYFFNIEIKCKMNDKMSTVSINVMEIIIDDILNENSKN